MWFLRCLNLLCICSTCMSTFSATLQFIQEVWKVSTTAGSKRVKKSASVPEATAAISHPTRESEATHKLTAHAATSFTSVVNQTSAHGDTSQVSFSLCYSHLNDLIDLKLSYLSGWCKWVEPGADRDSYPNLGS